MTAPPSELTSAVARYAGRFHRAVGSGHHVGSPLGAWLLLALVAPAASGAARERLVDALGCEPADARRFADAIIASGHPAVQSALAVWHEAAVETPALHAWLAGLARDVERGSVPTQAAADAWARERTLGLIKNFPIDIEQFVLVLASALATRVNWQSDFEEVPASSARLPRATGFAGASTLLDDPYPDCRLVASPVGTIAVHAKYDRDGDLVVVSVSADPAVAPDDVLDVAHVIAFKVARDGIAAGAVPLTDLPLGTGHSWTLTEEPPGRRWSRERYRALLPAWSASSEFELLADPSLGFGAAAETLLALLPPAGWQAEAKQVAIARYHRTGFEAAAVTTVGIRASASVGHRPPVLVAALEFTHPYAVVAVASSADTPWDGLPVFSAWVTQAEEP